METTKPQGKHTAGKWFSEKYDLTGIYVFAESEEFVDNPQICALAQCQDKSIKEIEANTQLIANAPETKRQRDELLKIAKNVEIYLKGDVEGDEHDFADNLLELTKQALAEKKG